MLAGLELMCEAPRNASKRRLLHEGEGGSDELPMRLLQSSRAQTMSLYVRSFLWAGNKCRDSCFGRRSAGAGPWWSASRGMSMRMLWRR